MIRKESLTYCILYILNIFLHVSLEKYSQILEFLKEVPCLMAHMHFAQNIFCHAFFQSNFLHCSSHTAINHQSMNKGSLVHSFEQKLSCDPGEAVWGHNEGGGTVGKNKPFFQKTERGAQSYQRSGQELLSLLPKTLSVCKCRMLYYDG